MRDLIRQKIIDSIQAPVPQFTKRDVYIPAIPRKSLAVIGVRRAGKTTFLWQMLAKRLEDDYQRSRLLVFSFEDERLAGMRGSDLNLIPEEYYRLYPEYQDRVPVVFYLDEIQLIPEWEAFCRRIMETEMIELVLSGSSSKMLSREVATSLRGRTMEAIVYPFSYRECLRHRGMEPPENISRMSKGDQSGLRKLLDTYLIEGGFPEAQNLNVRDRFSLLRGYVDACLFRDVAERHDVSHPVALRWLVRRLLGNPAGFFSINKFFMELKAQGFSISKDTLHDYLAFLEDAFLIQTIHIASESPRRQMVNPRKVYPVDSGLIPVFDRSGRSNNGHALESVIYIELQRRGAEVTYVKTTSGYEVDFLVTYPAGTRELIQVCRDIRDPVTQQREIRALLEAALLYPDATLHMITMDPVAWQPFPEKIAVHSAASWLMQSETPEKKSPPNGN